MGKNKPTTPKFDVPIYETHCHLDYLVQDAQNPHESMVALIQRACDAGVIQMLTIAVSPDNQETVLAIARQYPQVSCTQGVHPHEAIHWNENVEKKIRQHLNADPEWHLIKAIGEIGLDYYYDHSDKATQRTVFECQLALAVEFQLPVVIHARDADTDTAVILTEFAPDLTRKGVIHSFTAGLDFAQRCLELGFYLGFNGIITFNKADNVRAALLQTPLSRVLLETDAPYLTPVPYRGTTNEPSFLPWVALKVAEVKGLAVDKVLTQTTANANALFQF